jgi:hypothetical protein
MSDTQDFLQNPPVVTTANLIPNAPAWQTRRPLLDGFGNLHDQPPRFRGQCGPHFMDAGKGTVLILEGLQ